MAEDSIGRGSAAARDLSKQEPSAPHHRMMSERANNPLADFPRGDRSKGVAAGRKTSAMRVNARFSADGTQYMFTSDMSLTSIGSTGFTEVLAIFFRSGDPPAAVTYKYTETRDVDLVHPSSTEVIRSRALLFERGICPAYPPRTSRDQQ